MTGIPGDEMTNVPGVPGYKLSGCPWGQVDRVLLRTRRHDYFGGDVTGFL